MLEDWLTALDPVATVIIPTKNRRELLLRAIASALAQTIPVEVLVMDDAGTDGSGDAVRAAFPQVSVHRSQASRGPTWQRNEGARLAEAPFLVTLDDDCELVSPRSLERGLAEFDHPRVAAVTLPFINIYQGDAVHSRAPGPGRWVTLIYLGGMVMFRREVYLRVGGYRCEYFIQVEEPDLALRLLELGYVVRLGTADPIHHHESTSRDSAGRYVMGARNHILFAWFNAPWPQLALFLPVTTGRLLLSGFQLGQPRLVSKGIVRGWLDGPLSRQGRRPVANWAHRLGRRLKRSGCLPFEEVERVLAAHTSEPPERA